MHVQIVAHRRPSTFPGASLCVRVSFSQTKELLAHWTFCSTIALTRRFTSPKNSFPSLFFLPFARRSLLRRRRKARRRSCDALMFVVLLATSKWRTKNSTRRRRPRKTTRRSMEATRRRVLRVSSATLGLRSPSSSSSHDSKLPRCALLVYISISLCARDEGHKYPSSTRLASRTVCIPRDVEDRRPAFLFVTRDASSVSRRMPAPAKRLTVKSNKETRTALLKNSSLMVLLRRNHLASSPPSFFTCVSPFPRARRSQNFHASTK